MIFALSHHIRTAPAPCSQLCNTTVRTTFSYGQDLDPTQTGSIRAINRQTYQAFNESSKAQFQGQLANSWILCTQDLSEPRSRKADSRIVEPTVVQRVEVFGADLKLNTLHSQREALEEPHIPVERARASQAPFAGVAKRACRG